jgi:hypothetical protein
MDGNIAYALLVGGFSTLQHGMVLLGIRMQTREAQKPWCCIFGGVFPQDVRGEGGIVSPSASSIVWVLHKGTVWVAVGRTQANCALDRSTVGRDEEAASRMGRNRRYH